MTEQDLIIYTHWLQQKDAEIERLTAERDALRETLLIARGALVNALSLWLDDKPLLPLVPNAIAAIDAALNAARKEKP